MLSFTLPKRDAFLYIQLYKAKGVTSSSPKSKGFNHLKYPSTSRAWKFEMDGQWLTSAVAHQHGQEVELWG